MTYKDNTKRAVDALDKITKEIDMTATNNETLSNAQEADLTNALAELEGLGDVETIEPQDDGIEALDAIDDLEELETVSEAEAEPAEEAPAEEKKADGELLSDDELDELELEADKAEVYASQESTASVGESGKIEKEAGTKPKRSSTPRASTPRAPRDMASVPPEVFVLSGDVSAMSDDDKKAAKDAVMAATPGQKKVAEKFENLFQSMASGRAPSKYTMVAFAALDASKTITTSELVAAFKTSGSGEGTARSQTGQMMALFPVLGIAERDGKTLKLKDDSNIAAYLRTHVAA